MSITSVTLSEDIRKEFEINENGKILGKSVRGMARITGIDESSLRKDLFPRITAGVGLPESLKPFAGKDFNCGGKFEEEFIEALIYYYAFDSKASNIVARKTYRAFSRVGIRAWFQEQLNWSSNPMDRMTDYEKALYFAKALVSADEENVKLKAELEEAKPKLQTYDDFLNSFDAVDWIEAANILAVQVDGKNMGRTKLLEYLRLKNVIQQNKAIPYSNYSTSGYFKVVSKQRPNDPKRQDAVTLVTPLGLIKIAELLRQDGFHLNFNITKTV